MILHKWESCLNNEDLDKLVKLYSNEASLVSTFDNIFFNDKDGIKNYFQKLLKKNTKVKIKTNNIMKIENNYLEFGIYEFTNNSNKVCARFSMLSNGESIIHHHSSLCN